MEIKNSDFVKVEYDLYAEGKLTQTTNEKKAKENNLKSKSFGPQPIIIGKNFILKALDDDILKNQSTEKRTLDLNVKEAFGEKQRDLIKVLPKSAFNEHQTKPVVGGVYDFNGMFGTVKSITGGRVMVDFNNPLAGKNIKIEYKIIEKVEDITEKISIVFENILRIPKNMFKITKQDKNLIYHLPEQLLGLKDVLNKTVKEYINELDNYSIKIENFKNQ